MLPFLPMKYYPVCLRVRDRACVVVGGGLVGERKAVSLLEAAARVTVVSPALTPVLAAHAARGRLVHQARRYLRGDLRGCLLAFAATGDEAVDREMAREAEAEGVLLNVADVPALCGFIMPSMLVRGDLMVAVSTSGGSPALAGRLRREIDQVLGPEYEQALEVLARLRERLQAACLPAVERQALLAGLVDSELLDCLRNHDAAAADRVLARFAGSDVSLATLGIGSNDGPLG